MIIVVHIVTMKHTRCHKQIRYPCSIVVWQLQGNHHSVFPIPKDIEDESMSQIERNPSQRLMFKHLLCCQRIEPPYQRYQVGNRVRMQFSKEVNPKSCRGQVGNGTNVPQKLQVQQKQRNTNQQKIANSKINHKFILAEYRILLLVRET